MNMNWKEYRVQAKLKLKPEAIEGIYTIISEFYGVKKQLALLLIYSII